MEEMLDPTFVADEAKALVDEEPRDSARWHTEASVPNPQGHPKGTQPGRRPKNERDAVDTESRPSRFPASAQLEIRASLGSSMLEVKRRPSFSGIGAVLTCQVSSSSSSKSSSSSSLSSSSLSS